MLTGNDLLTAVQNFSSMTERVKFTQVSRVICPKTGIHYLDAISADGIHWTGQMETGVEKWITWKEQWKKNNQQPFDTL